MAPAQVEEDYYEILEVIQTADKASIKASYRRLALVRHPDKNPNKPNATAEFQLLSVAHDTLIDDQKRRQYDTLHYPSIQLRRQQSKNHKSYGSSYPGPAAAAEAFAHQTQPSAESAESRKRLDELKARLRELQARSQMLRRDMDEAQRAVKKTRLALQKIQEEEEETKREVAARQGWFNYMFGPRESTDVIEARERRATERRLGRLVREAELERRQREYSRLGAEMVALGSEIGALHVNMAAEERRQKETARREDEARRAELQRQRAKRESEWRQRMAEEARQAAEAQRARERQHAQMEHERRCREQEARTAQTRAREEAAKKWRSDYEEAMERQMKAREVEEKSKKRDVPQEKEREKEKQNQRHNKSGEENKNKNSTGKERSSHKVQPHETSTCTHKAWWNKVDGKQQCGHCGQMKTLFAYQCPGCSIIACVGCRIILKQARNQAAGKGRGTGKGK